MGRRCRPRGGRLRRLLRLDRVHHGQILSREALVVLPRFVQEHAVAVVALLATEVRGAVLGGAVLRPVVGKHTRMEVSFS